MLIAEYKRDMSQNYLILPMQPETDPDTYQTRMLLTHAVPGLLGCTIQHVDGVGRFYYDITSRCSLAELFENRQLEYGDLKLIFGGFIQVMEGIAEYLMSASSLVLEPEYIFADAEKKRLTFCYLPGYDQEIRMQFQKLTEYILPKLDHKDPEGVMLGYGVYRRALEDTFHLEHIKEELYRNGSGAMQEKKEPGGFQPDRESQPRMQVQNFAFEKRADSDSRHEEGAALAGGEEAEPLPPWQTGRQVEKEPVQDKYGLLIRILMGAAGVILLLVAAILKQMGYLSGISTEALLGGMTALMAGGALIAQILSKRRPREEGGETKRESKKRKSKANIRLDSGMELRENPQPWEEADPAALKKSGRPKSAGAEAMADFNPGRLMPQPESKKPAPAVTPGAIMETVVLTAANLHGPAALVSREPGELPTIYLSEELTVIGKLENAADAVIDLPTVSRVHAKIRRQDDEYYLSDLNSRNGTTVNGHVLSSQEQWCLADQDEVDFASARYLFIK